MYHKIKSFFENIKQYETIQHYTAHFTTIDGLTHHYTKYRYACPSKILCSIPEYIMISVKDDGYMLDDEGNMYPLHNITSIKWEMDDEINNFPTIQYQVYYDKPVDS